MGTNNQQSQPSLVILFNKPFGVLSQFRTDQGAPCLQDYIPIKNVYAAGRLDKDSEGLMLLTDNGRLQYLISHPRFKLPKTYWVQVEGVPQENELHLLEQGVVLKDGPTKPCSIVRIPEPDIWPRQPPVRFRANIPTSWLKISLREGRNRQVRRMTAHIGYPTLRLIRIAVGPWLLNGLLPGELKQLAVHNSDLPPSWQKQLEKPVQSRQSRQKGRNKSGGRKQGY